MAEMQTKDDALKAIHDFRNTEALLSKLFFESQK